MKEHMNMFFSDKGLGILHNYTKTLIKEWHKKEDKEYPFVLGIVFGIPFFNSTTNERKFNNKSELEGRIKGYMQLMNLKTIEVELSSGKLIFDIGDK